jgi:hypothetical protein
MPAVRADLALKPSTYGNICNHIHAVKIDNPVAIRTAEALALRPVA